MKGIHVVSTFISHTSYGASITSWQVLVLEAVKQHGYALEYAAPKLKADREFMLEF